MLSALFLKNKPKADISKASTTYIYKGQMRVAIVQNDIKKDDTSYNLAHIAELITTVDSVDMILLPEMFHCGFSETSARNAQDNGGVVLEWMKQTARDKQAYVGGTVSVRDGEAVYNRFYMVGPQGDVSHYDKRHLFTMGMESRSYTPGSERVVLNIGGVKVLLLVCYDLRFPVWSRNADDYDVAVYSANWPKPRRDVWLTLLKARAIENQCYVVGVNRSGETDGIYYSGDSVVYGARGEEVAHANNDGGEDVVIADLNIDAIHSFREKFRVLADRDSFNIVDERKSE